MNQHPKAKIFPDNVDAALNNKTLQGTLRRVSGGFVEKRAVARNNLPEFDDLRDAARDMKNHTLEHLDLYLEDYEHAVTNAGGHVHWAENIQDAQQIVLDICADAKAKTICKGKSMVTEEIELNHALEGAGYEVIETDLGEYIIQLRHETPSHIIAPAVHVNKEQVEQEFRAAHSQLDPNRRFADSSSLVQEARQVLREKYFRADVGVTGANMLIAETGQSVIVTNEGNGDLTQSLARIHIVVASLEKVVPTLDDATTVLRVLARSATGQPITSYTTFSNGPRRIDDPDGPQEYHVVLVDNGRSLMLGSDFQDMLRCIRCGACMNHCPVYQAVGGHAYGSVYPGPMGAVLTPALTGIDESGHLPNASTFCGRCEAVCPMRIPLPKMMRHWREREFDKNLSPPVVRYGLSFWGFFAKRPKLYHFCTSWANQLLRIFANGKGRFSYMPLMGGWTRYRDMTAPQAPTFQRQWSQHKRRT
ncbi:MAG: LutB/LldF family L-lactate oxidation iron-sulfur protein [Hyphomicrobiaceae bacterium]